MITKDSTKADQCSSFAEFLVTRFVRDGYNYDTNKLSNETGLLCKDPTLTQQNSKDECDINNIINQFNVMRMQPVQPLPEHFGDFTHVTDFQTALEALQEAKETFADLPANLRARFDNNPSNLIHFLENSDNRAEAIKLGLIAEPVEGVLAQPQTPGASSST